MRKPSHRSLVAGLCALACAVGAATFLWPAGRDVRTGDENRDGRPDIWRVYDRDGQLSQVDVDANFDGRADVREYYEHGALVRRESDRNFNDRIDLIQQFDSGTHELARTIEDVD